MQAGFRDRGPKTLRRKILFSAITCALILPILVELLAFAVMVDCRPSYLLARHYPHDQVKTHCGAMRAEWRTNSQGFHDREHPKDKPAEEIRIVCIGDSFLDGPHDDPLPLRLRSELRKRHPAAEVINLSQVGITLDRYLVLLKEVALDYDPDHVQVYLCAENDFSGLESLTPEPYMRMQGVFKRYPEASLYGYLFPRTTILIHDILEGRMLYRWTDISTQKRWGKEPFRTGSLRKSSRLLATYIDAESRKIYDHLAAVMTEAEIKDLTGHAVRHDFLAYLTATGLGTGFSDRWGRDPSIEFSDTQVLEAQVKGALDFLRCMARICKEREIGFEVVLIPTSWADPDCRDLYDRLCMGDAPLNRARLKQVAELEAGLQAEGIVFFNLSRVLEALPGSYLPFDTHWTDKGVDGAVSVVAENLIRSGLFSSVDR